MKKSSTRPKSVLPPLSFLILLFLSTFCTSSSNNNNNNNNKLTVPKPLDPTLNNRGGDDSATLQKKKRKKRKKANVDDLHRQPTPSSSSSSILDPEKAQPKLQTTKTTTKKTTPQTTKKRNIISGQTATKHECLRRLKREWKDAIDLDIAYDWQAMETVQTKTTKRKARQQQNTTNNNNNSTANDDNNNNIDSRYVRVGPFRGNLLKWHFTFSGPIGSVYEGGLYHGRVILPKNYPGSPPRVQVITPSGRFQAGADICLTASNFHPETWTPRWTILALINALRLHMLTPANEIGGLQATHEQRRKMAYQSRVWKLRSYNVDSGRVLTLVDHERMLPLFFSKEDDDFVNSTMTTTTTTDLQQQELQESLQTAKTPIKTETIVTQQQQKRGRNKTTSSKLDLIQIGIRTVVLELFHNPVRMAVLCLLTVFAILNQL